MAVTRRIPIGDLALEHGDLVVLGTTAETRIQYLRQKIAARFQFFQGEWFLDLREGIPYYRDVFVKNPSDDRIRALFLRVLRQTPGVLKVVSFSTVYDPSARRLAFAFQAVVDGGEITVTAEDEAFVVALAPAA